MGSRRRAGGLGGGRCTHVPCLILREDGGRSFRGKCLVCGYTGPSRPSLEAAREALDAGSERGDAGDHEPRRDLPHQRLEFETAGWGEPRWTLGAGRSSLAEGEGGFACASW